MPLLSIFFRELKSSKNRVDLYWQRQLVPLRHCYMFFSSRGSRISICRSNYIDKNCSSIMSTQWRDEMPTKRLSCDIFRWRLVTNGAKTKMLKIFFNKFSIKSFLVSETFSMNFLSILFLALEYWFSDISNIAIYKVSFQYRNSCFSVTSSLVSSTLISAESLKLVEIDWRSKSLIFSSHPNFQNPNFPKYAVTFDLFRHAKSSLTASTGFIFSTKVAIKMFPLLRNNIGNNYPFRSLWLTSDCQENSASFFRYEVFSIF